jgi:hypothetical protein
MKCCPDAGSDSANDDERYTDRWFLYIHSQGTTLVIISVNRGLVLG